MVKSKNVYGGEKKPGEKCRTVDRNYTAHCGISFTLGIREILRGKRRVDECTVELAYNDVCLY